jgi:PadR family transcriptional regulator, regulatory protein PadR
LTLVTALRRGTLEYCVLALLAGREMYGLELVRHLSAALGMTTSEGTLYPLLSRLRRTERIASTWRESPQGPPRRYYTLTPSGTRALANFRVEWEAFRTGIDRILGENQS